MNPRRLKTNFKFHRHVKKGVEAVELAVCLPIIFMVIFGAIESSHLIFLKQAPTQAAYEGALEASKPEATETIVSDHVNAIVTARRISGVTIHLNESVTRFDAVPSGENFSIRVEADTTSNLISARLFASDSSINATMTARKQ